MTKVEELIGEELYGDMLAEGTTEEVFARIEVNGITDAEWAKLEKDSPLVLKWIFIWGIAKWFCVTAMTVAGIWGFVQLVTR